VTETPQPAPFPAEPRVADPQRKAQAGFFERPHRFVPDETCVQRQTIEQEWNRPIRRAPAPSKASVSSPSVRTGWWHFQRAQQLPTVDQV